MIGVYKIIAIIVMFMIYIQLRTDLIGNFKLSEFYDDFQVDSVYLLKFLSLFAMMLGPYFSEKTEALEKNSFF